jgi:hypothetical protein
VSTPVASVCDAKAGSRVAVKGFLRLPDQVAVTDRAVIDLFSRRAGSGDRASVELLLGDGPNQLERPEAGFTATSMRVHSKRGVIVTLNDTVVVEGKVTARDSSCVLTDVTVRVVAT